MTAAVAMAGRPPRMRAGAVVLRYSIGRVVGRLAGWLWITIVLAILVGPIVVIVGASFDGRDQQAFVSFPPEQVSLLWYGRIPPQHLHAMGLSIVLATVSTLVACAVGLPGAIGLVRSSLPGKAVLGALFRAPLQIPAVVVGLAFLQLYVLIGDLTGFYPTSTFLGLVVAHAFLGVPYVIGTVVAVLQRMNPRLEEAAATLGAGPWRSFRRVLLPIVMPGVYAGALYAFMSSFGDVAVSMFLGSGPLTTYPVEIFYAREFSFDPSILASSSLAVIGSLIVVTITQRLVGLGTLVDAERRR